MTISLQELPNDVESLKRIIVEQEQAMERLQAKHKAALAALFGRYYGPRSERFDPRQLLLFGQRIVDAKLDQASIAEEAGEQLVTRRIKNRDRRGRQQLPEHLERIEIEHDLTDKACPAWVRRRRAAGVPELPRQRL